jgi:alpha-glucoside transport system substrate-binding protein
MRRQRVGIALRIAARLALVTLRRQRVGVALRIAAGLALVALVTLAGGGPGTASGSPSPTGTITVVASWTGQEEADFKQVLKPFEDSTGIQVNYTGTRALDQLLQSDIEQGSPPDLAILPSPGQLLSYQQRGYLHALDTVLSQQTIAADYGSDWLNIMKLGTPHIYTLPVKANVQNLVWYDPKKLPSSNVPSQTKPPSWDFLTKLEGTIIADRGTPWCLGLDSTPVSGWPGTDWIADILLHQSGPADYRQWADGTLAWTAPPVQAAWEAWGSLVARPGQVHGGSMGALLTDWDKAGEPLFATTPGCYLQHLPSFNTLNYQGYSSDPKPGTGYNFFPLPMTGLPGATSAASTDAWDVSADLLGMFNDTPAARQLVAYLATARAQQIWPAIRGGGASSADSKVPKSVYPDQRVDATIAEIITNPHLTLCFNASDLMPVTMQNAFYQAVMEYLQNPSQLRAILQRLDLIRQASYPESFVKQPNFTCGP